MITWDPVLVLERLWPSCRSSSKDSKASLTCSTRAVPPDQRARRFSGRSRGIWPSAGLEAGGSQDARQPRKVWNYGRRKARRVAHFPSPRAPRRPSPFPSCPCEQNNITAVSGFTSLSPSELIPIVRYRLAADLKKDVVRLDAVLPRRRVGRYVDANKTRPLGRSSCEAHIRWLRRECRTAAGRTEYCRTPPDQPSHRHRHRAPNCRHLFELLRDRACSISLSTLSQSA